MGDKSIPNPWDQLTSGNGCRHSPSTCEHTDSERLSFIEDLAAGRYSPKTMDWLKRGAQALLESDGQVGLDQALGLKKGRGHHSWSTRLAITRQRIALRDAWDLLSHYPLPWNRAEQLAEEIKKFSEQIWPSWRELQDPPRGASKMRVALHSAFKTQNGKLPRGAKGLYNAMVILDPIHNLSGGETDTEP